MKGEVLFDDFYTKDKIDLYKSMHINSMDNMQEFFLSMRNPLTTTLFSDSNNNAVKVKGVFYGLIEYEFIFKA